MRLLLSVGVLIALIPVIACSQDLQSQADASNNIVSSPSAGENTGGSHFKKMFFEAVKTEDTQTVKECISRGIAVNTPEVSGGWSALHYAVQAGNEEIVKLLLDAGADPNYVGHTSLNKDTAIDLTPLAVAKASLRLAQYAQNNPYLGTQDFDREKNLKDPNAPAKYKRIIRMLEAASHKK